MVNSLFLPFTTNGEKENKDASCTSENKTKKRVPKQSHRLLTSEDELKETLLAQQKKEERERKKVKTQIRKAQRELKNSELGSKNIKTSKCVKGEENK